MLISQVLPQIAMSQRQAAVQDFDQIEQWKFKRLIDTLDAAAGEGTSVISLYVLPKNDINLVVKTIAEERALASNIKSRVNRQSVQDALVSVQERLRRYPRTPPNGLAIFCGNVTTETGKERKVTIDFEPPRPISTKLYMCDSRFHTDGLKDLLQHDQIFGFLVVDGNGALYGTVQGNHRQVLHKFSVTLPNKHGRGGQSALRFARLRLEKRRNYVRKVCELATQHFITDDKPNVAGLVVAGFAELKDQVVASELFDPRLGAVLLRPMVDISYGGECGFSQAIDQVSDRLKDVKFVQEKRLLTRFLDEVSRDTGRYCFGVEDTLRALEMGAVETLIVWESLSTLRLQLRHPQSDEVQVRFCRPRDFSHGEAFRCPDTGAELDVVGRSTLVEWIVDEHKNFGATLELITDRSAQGSQFCKGFGGVGGLLRYKVKFDEMQRGSDSDSDFGENDEDFM